MDDVHIVEVATTGPKGFPMDRVIEVAVCRMHRDGNDFDTVYDSFVFADPMDIGKDALDYIQENYGVTAETLYAAPDVDIVSKELLMKLRDAECTSFDVNLTFGAFLCVEPWDLNGEVTLFTSISNRLPPEHSRTLKEAYDYVTPGNPMEVTGSTAMDRCLMSTSIMMKLRQTGYFRPHPRTTTLNDARASITDMKNRMRYIRRSPTPTTVLSMPTSSSGTMLRRSTLPDTKKTRPRTRKMYPFSCL